MATLRRKNMFSMVCQKVFTHSNPNSISSCHFNTAPSTVLMSCISKDSSLISTQSPFRTRTKRRMLLFWNRPSSRWSSRQSYSRSLCTSKLSSTPSPPETSKAETLQSTGKCTVVSTPTILSSLIQTVSKCKREPSIIMTDINSRVVKAGSQETSIQSMAP